MNTYRLVSLKTLCATIWFLLAFSIPAFSQTLFDLYSFSGGTDEQAPYAGLIQASDGNFYGTTYGVTNTSNRGTIFKMTPNGVLTTLYSFAGYPHDGEFPTGALIQASDGDLYGTTYSGGTNGAGTVFKITTSGKYTQLHFFTIAEGHFPNGPLVQASDGNLYGITYQGGIYGGYYGYGTVFKITTSGTLTTLYSFGFSDGAYPDCGLIQASDGNLYGTTTAGGPNDAGTVFKITPAGTHTTLYSFSGGSDGALPYSGVIQANDGNLYGTTWAGGNGNGTLFRITTSGTLTTIHDFIYSDGAGPRGSLIQASDGNLYGTTSYAASGWGTVFVATTGGTLLTLHVFTGSDGGTSFAGLIEGRDGYLYGTTINGGVYSNGVMFALDGVYYFPYLSSLSPSSIDAGASAFTLTVKGAYFQPFSTIDWNGTPLTTTYVSPNQLKATVPASLIATPGNVSITVVTGAGGGTSNARTLTILPTSLKLASATLTKGSMAYTVSLTLKNAGYNTASNVTLTKATLNAAATTTSLPVTVGNMAAGASGNTSVRFPVSAGASGTIVTLKVSGKFTGGAFSSSLKVKLP